MSVNLMARVLMHSCTSSGDPALAGSAATASKARKNTHFPLLDIESFHNSSANLRVTAALLMEASGKYENPDPEQI
jgi:hypothetical protein